MRALGGAAGLGQALERLLEEQRVPSGRLEQPRDVIGVVRAVSVHLADRLVARGQRPCEARPVRGAEAGLGWAVEHVDAVVTLREPVGELSRAVGRIVVDDERYPVVRRELA